MILIIVINYIYIVNNPFSSQTKITQIQKKINLIRGFNMFFKSIYLVDFFSILSKHEEHNKCPFFSQNVLVDLSISLRQIKHLNMGVTKSPKLVVNLIINTFKVSSFNYF